MKERGGERVELQTLIVDDRAVMRFHPNMINNKDFWVHARKYFPLLSVCGSPCKNRKEVNDRTLSMHKYLGALDFVKDRILKSENKLEFLEIGFGYGNVFHLLKDCVNYTGIDYVIPRGLKKYKNFIELDESGIPDYLLNDDYYDIIYSVNVLQHCSTAQRRKYFSQANKVLKPGGHFVFSINLRTETNKDMQEFWGLKDLQGKVYTQFFNQLTEVDDWKELKDDLEGIGFKIFIDQIKMMNNHACIVIQKK
jgi:SAM-dependent methyltransferase